MRVAKLKVMLLFSWFLTGSLFLACGCFAEMELLCHVSHESICRLLAYSTDGPQRCLVLELCSGGSLEKRLSLKCSDTPLQWDHRLRIAVSIARALVHLHSLDPPMLHRDVRLLIIKLNVG